MKEIRLKRYNDKINYIIDNIKDLPVEPANELEKRGIFYSIQTSIESAIDLVAMLTKDLGMQVKDDSANISELINKRILESELGKQLKKANGLRNFLVHRNNGVDDQIMLVSVEETKVLLFKWLDVVEEVLNDFTIDE